MHGFLHQSSSFDKARRKDAQRRNEPRSLENLAQAFWGNSSQGATERSSEQAHSILGDPEWTAHTDRLSVNGLRFVVSQYPHPPFPVLSVRLNWVVLWTWCVTNFKTTMGTDALGSPL